MPQPRRERRAKGVATSPTDNPLFEALRERRRELAKEAGVPPYVIFHDSVLRAMALARPRSLPELGRIAGVGTAKLERYGEAFLEVLRAHG